MTNHAGRFLLQFIAVFWMGLAVGVLGGAYLSFKTAPIMTDGAIR